MNAEQRSAMFDRALKLNAVDRAELRARKAVRRFMGSRVAAPVIVVGAWAALEGSMRGVSSVVEVLLP